MKKIFYSIILTTTVFADVNCDSFKGEALEKTKELLRQSAPSELAKEAKNLKLIATPTSNPNYCTIFINGIPGPMWDGKNLIIGNIFDLNKMQPIEVKPTAETMKHKKETILNEAKKLFEYREKISSDVYKFISKSGYIFNSTDKNMDIVKKKPVVIVYDPVCPMCVIINNHLKEIIGKESVIEIPFVLSMHGKVAEVIAVWLHKAPNSIRAKYFEEVSADIIDGGVSRKSKINEIYVKYTKTPLDVVSYLNKTFSTNITVTEDELKKFETYEKELNKLLKINKTPSIYEG